MRGYASQTGFPNVVVPVYSLLLPISSLQRETSDQSLEDSVNEFTYITDAKTIPPGSREQLFGLDLLILNALRFKPHLTHLNIEEALKVCEELQPKQCFLTHISHEMGLQEEVNAMLPAHIRLGYDGQTIKLA